MNSKATPFRKKFLFPSKGPEYYTTMFYICSLVFCIHIISNLIIIGKSITSYMVQTIGLTYVQCRIAFC